MSKQETSLSWLYKLWASGYKDSPMERARHERTSFWLAIAILPLLVTAHSTLGFVFGLQVGRPGWHSALQAPGFVILAGACGVGFLIVCSFMLRRIAKLREELGDEIFAWLGKFMLALLVIYLYFMVVEILTAVYTGSHHEREVMYVMLKGEYSLVFWSATVCLAVPAAILFVQWIYKWYDKYVLFFCALLVNIGAILKRYSIVVPSQTHGTLLPYQHGSYSPTWVEYGVLMGVISFGIFVFLLFIKIFPILNLKKEGESVEEKISAPIEFGRVGFCLIVVAIGFVLQFVSYFYLSAPLGIPTSEVYSNPKIPFSPVIFIVGVMLVFMGAILYEVLPGKKEEPQKI
jgi:molybdopterin-containing oxidoreductase family membrane subunit